MAWTTPATLVTGDVIQASWANTHVRDNSRYLKGLDGDTAFSDGATFADHVGIGGSNTHRVMVQAAAAAIAAAKFTNSAGDSGVFIVTAGDGNNYVCMGAEFVSPNWVARDTVAVLMQHVSTGFIFYVNTGLTDGNSYTPTEAFRITTSGVTVTGTATATTFSGSGASLTSLPAAQLTGSVAAARVSHLGVSTFSNDSGYLTSASSIAATQLTGGVFSVSQSIANNGTYTVCAATAGGWFALRDDQGNTAILYLYSGPLQSELSDPFSVFTFTSGTASSWNLYTSGGNIIIENKRGSTRTITITRLAGG